MIAPYGISFGGISFLHTRKASWLKVGIVAVATAAIRDASNGAVFIERIRRELRIQVGAIDGRQEALYGFLGAVRGLPVSSGVLFDLGGGSMQISHFAHRKLGRAISLPLGALRLSETFLRSDPPKPGEIRKLRDYVRTAFDRVGIGWYPNSDFVHLDLGRVRSWSG